MSIPDWHYAAEDVKRRAVDAIGLIESVLGDENTPGGLKIAEGRLYAARERLIEIRDYAQVAIDARDVEAIEREQAEEVAFIDHRRGDYDGGPF